MPRTSFVEMKTWSVPGMDSENECWVAWSLKLNGYFLGTRTPEGEMFATDGYASLVSLIVATTGAVVWNEVPPGVLAELHRAPTLAYVDSEYASPHERAVAQKLIRVFAS